MRFFRFQKKPLFNRDFVGNPQKVPFSTPPGNPQKTPFLTILAILDPPFGVTFWPPKKPQKTPKTTLFDPPKTDPPPKILENGPFGENRGFQARFEPQKGGGGGGLPRDPPKRPFLAIFAHFGHFCPFWPFLAIFGHFLTPQILAAKCERKWRFLTKKGEKTPPETPLARQTISNNRVIRPQIRDLRENRGFSHRCGKCEHRGQISLLLLLIWC